MNQLKDPRSTARNVLKQVGISDLRDLILEDFIRWHPGCHLNEASMKASQGRIQFKGSSALITVNSDIKSKGQKRFVMAHEFGHFNLHNGLQPFFTCDDNSFNQWLSQGEHEREANEFAAELLLPKKILNTECSSNSFSVDLIRYLSERFETSLTATSIRVVEQGPYPLALVYSENGIVRWSTVNAAFPLKYIVKKTMVPPDSAAGRLFNSGISNPKIISPNVWFFSDFKLGQYSNLLLRETLLDFPYYGGVLSFLSFAN